MPQQKQRQRNRQKLSCHVTARIYKLDLDSLVLELMGTVGGGFLVPSMLQNIGPFPWENYKASDRIATAIMEDVPCFHITLPMQQGSMQFWIGKSDFLLRKISTSMPSGDEEIYYETVDTSNTQR